MDSVKWDAWHNAEETKMRGMVENSVYEQVAQPKTKLVVGTKMLYNGKFKNYNGQVEGVHYKEKYSYTLAAMIIRGVLRRQQPRTRSCTILIQRRHF